MKKAILEALKAKFPGVSDTILDRIAAKLAKTVTSEEQVASVVEAVTFQQVLESYGDSRATEAQQTAVSNYEKKYGLKDGQKVEHQSSAGGAQANQQQQAGGAEQVPSWAQAIIDSNKTLADRLDRLDGERTTANRKQQLAPILEKLPENIRKAYERTPVDNLTEEQFNALVGEITSEVDGIVGAIQAKGAVFGRPTVKNGQENNGDKLTKEQQEAIAHRESKAKDGQPF